MEHPEDCELNDDDHELIVNVEYVLGQDDEGNFVPRAAAIRSHVHGVPVEVAAQTLVIIAHKILGDHMAHEQFEAVPNERLKHAMGKAAAGVYLIEAIKHAPSEDDIVSTVIPDDISELLGD